MAAPVRVLLMVQELNFGGSERQLAEMALALDRSRFDVRVGSFRRGGMRADELRAGGVPVVHFPVPSMMSVRGAVQIASYIRAEGIRLVHTFDTPANLYGVPAARMAGGAVVVSSQRAHRGLMPALTHHALRLTDRMVDAIVVNCEFVQWHLIEEEHVPAGLIRLCYNGIDARRFRRGDHARPDALRGASLVVGIVCVLRPEKGIPTLLEAFAAVRGVQTGMKLAIVGSGPCLPELQRRASEVGIGEECVFQPATAEVAAWLGAMDIFVLPSLSEALSNSLMEAMASGCCSVASRVGGNPELVTHGETGMLFKAGDSAGLAQTLRTLIDNGELRDSLGKRASESMREDFSLEAAARGMEKIYGSLLR